MDYQKTPSLDRSETTKRFCQRRAMKKIPRQRPRDNGNGLVVGCAKPLVEQPIILLTIPSLAGPAIHARRSREKDRPQSGLKRFDLASILGNRVDVQNLFGRRTKWPKPNAGCRSPADSNN